MRPASGGASAATEGPATLAGGSSVAVSMHAPLVRREEEHAYEQDVYHLQSDTAACSCSASTPAGADWRAPVRRHPMVSYMWISVR